MELSVVIPTYNRLAMLEKVIAALDQQLDAPGFEVVVVNDGSHDGTAERLIELAAEDHPFEFRHHTQGNAGPGKARNHGVQMARGRYVTFIGDDTVPARDFLSQHYRVHVEHDHDPMLACLGYTGWPDDGSVTPFMEYINDYGLQFGYALIDDQTVVPFNFFYTSNISVDRNLLAEYPFDTSFPAAAWEDIELAYRLERLGLRIFYNASAVTRHHHPTSVESFCRRQYTVGKSGAIFGRMHPELRHFLGIQELEDSGYGNPRERRWLELAARLGERVRFAAKPEVFERLMRIYYLRGLEAGIREEETVL